jgi:hypothetical protein
MWPRQILTVGLRVISSPHYSSMTMLTFIVSLVSVLSALSIHGIPYVTVRRLGARTWPLERELDDGDPAGKVDRVTFDDTWHKQTKTSAKPTLSAPHVSAYTLNPTPHVYIHIYIYRYTYIHIYIHTHTHTHIYIIHIYIIHIYIYVRHHRQKLRAAALLQLCCNCCMPCCSAKPSRIYIYMYVCMYVYTYV